MSTKSSLAYANVEHVMIHIYDDFAGVGPAISIRIGGVTSVTPLSLEEAKELAKQLKE